MRKTIIAGNWKMNKNITEAIELANGLRRALYQLGDSAVDIILCPPYTALAEVAEVIQDSNIQLGAQDLFWEDSGAYTGEVSAPLLKDAGAKFVIIGHSERRQYFGESNESVNKKLKAALKHGLTPIVCVGETLKEREEQKTFKVLEDHVNNGLRGLTADEASLIVLAYEPVWAIGTGKTATSAQAQEAHKYIRGLVEKLFGREVADVLRIQYGGSVKPDNSAELIAQADVDGALVGGASLTVDSFSQIVNKASEVKK